MKLLLPLVIGLAALAGGAAAQTVTIIDDGPSFSWRLAPNWADVSEVLVDHAAGNTPKDAITIVECTINKSYRPDDCKVIEEPANSTLGKGAAQIAKLYRALSTDAAGKSTVGRRVRLSFAYGGMQF
jgi:hypothetical protein